jgi:hypothetical protein
MTSEARKPHLTGGCQCGAVRYALYAEPTGAGICHCRMCQKAAGNYFTASTGVKRADFAWTRGKPGSFRSSELVERDFCRDCGTPLAYRALDRDRVSVSIGSLDQPDRVHPAMQHGIEGRLPDFEKFSSLPGDTTDAWAGERLSKLASRQHPDHDTTNWKLATGSGQSGS